ncbi:MAG: hypothetical protein ABSH19_04255 [Opitutales bacterium]|jgi:hypothetical protein
MEALGIFLIVVGGLAALAGHIWLLVVANRLDAVWFVACLFMPPVGLVLLGVEPRRVWLPLAICYGGLLVVGAGFMTFAQSEPSEPAATFSTPP